MAPSDDTSSTPVIAPTLARATIPVRDANGNVRAMAVSVVKGRATIGDMGFGAIDDPRPRSLSVLDPTRLWPDGRVPFCFYTGSDPDNGWETQIAKDGARAAFRNAVSFLTERVPTLQFEDRDACPLDLEQGSSGYGDIVVVMEIQPDSANAAWAEVGRQGDAQGIRLPKHAGIDRDDPTLLDPGRGRGTIVHELMHVLGLFHEHQRSDRWKHMKVCEVNIHPDTTGNFDVIVPTDGLTLTPYDYHSRMHYDANNGLAPAADRDMTQCHGHALEPINDTVPEIDGIQNDFGSNPHLSKHDRNQLALLYGRSIGRSSAQDWFGGALALGDFDGDGYPDIAVGAPKNDSDGLNDTGAVFVFKGTERFPTPWKTLSLAAASPRRADDRFGSALAVGDFNGDGFADLAVGVPGRLVNGVRSGGVEIFFGGRFAGTHFYLSSASTYVQCPTGCAGTEHAPLRASILLTPPAGEPVNDGKFGHALAAGDFNGDGVTDLAIGAPGSAMLEGRVYVYSGVAQGPNTPPQMAAAGTFAAPLPVAGAHFGYALAAGRLDDQRDDLAVGAPFGTSGSVTIFRSNTDGLHFSHQLPLPPGDMTGAQFGGSLAIAPLLTFSGNGRGTLAVGAPSQRNGTSASAGAFHTYWWLPGQASMVRAQTIQSGSASSVSYGTALAIGDVEGNGTSRLVVGAQHHGERNEGRVVVFAPTAASNNLQLAEAYSMTGENTVGLGNAFAIGVVRIDAPPLFPSFKKAARIVAGASLSAPDDVSQAGKVLLFSVENGGLFEKGTLTQQVKSPFAL